MKISVAFVLITVYVQISSIEGHACLQGWTYYTNSCYRIFQASKSWKNARGFCKLFPGGDLVSFLSSEERMFVDTFGRDDLIWIGLKYVNSTWNWIDGTKLTTNDTLYKQTENISSVVPLCGAYNDSSWITQTCDTKSFYACRSQTVACLGSALLTTPSHHCINIMNTTHGQTWSAAREYCRARGSDLAMLHNGSDVEFLQKLSLNSDYWIGFSYDPDSNKFVWIDGTTIPPESLTPDADFPCGAIQLNKSNSSNITLFNGQCSDRLKFICELASCASDPKVFACEQNLCIDYSKVCDGHSDCSDGADESTDFCERPNVTETETQKDITDLVETSTYGNLYRLLLECITTNDIYARKECFKRYIDETQIHDDALNQIFESAENGDVTDVLEIFTEFLDVLLEHDHHHNGHGKQHVKTMPLCQDIDTFVQKVIFLDKLHGTSKIAQANVEMLLCDVHHIPYHQKFQHIFTRASVRFSFPPLQMVSEFSSGDTRLLIIVLDKESYEKLPASDLDNDLKDGDTYRISSILSIALFKGRRKISFPNSFSLHFDPGTITNLNRNASIKTNIMCGFINDSKRAWSTEGCTVLTTTSTVTKCRCNHTTNFAVLMQVTSVELQELHELALNIITYIGCSVSLITQLITLTVFTCVGSLNSERVYVHRNLCLAIVAAQISFLAGIKAIQFKIVCSIVALILHYFYTSVFVWMLVEGLHLYSKVVQVFGTEKSRAMYYFGFGWGVPLVLVTISAAADWDGYGTATSCWLSTKKGTVWAFVGPALAVILVNVVILWMVVRIVMSSAKLENNGEFDHIRAGVKGAMFLLPLLGLTWVFGLLAVNEDLIVFQYLFAICNSLQGFFIFLFHCVCNSEVRQALRRMKEKRSLQKGEFNSSSNSSGTRSSSLKPKANQIQDIEAQHRKPLKSTHGRNTPPTSSTHIDSRCSIDSGKQGCLNRAVTIQDLTANDRQRTCA